MRTKLTLLALGAILLAALSFYGPLAASKVFHRPFNYPIVVGDVPSAKEILNNSRIAMENVSSGKITKTFTYSTKGTTVASLSFTHSTEGYRVQSEFIVIIQDKIWSGTQTSSGDVSWELSYQDPVDEPRHYSFAQGSAMFLIFPMFEGVLNGIDALEGHVAYHIQMYYVDPSKCGSTHDLWIAANTLLPIREEGTTTCKDGFASSRVYEYNQPVEINPPNVP